MRRCPGTEEAGGADRDGGGRAVRGVRTAPAGPLVAALTAFGLLAASPAGVGAQDPSPPAPDPSPPAPDLRGFFDEGWILQDRNGDGHPDFVEVRVVVPARPGSAATAAAANLSARLGFEAYGIDLDFLVPDGEGGPWSSPVVAVGTTPSLLASAGIDPEAALADLAPGEGSVRRLAPSDVLPLGGLWVAGADDTGLLAAAEYLAARYPGVWDPGGTTFGELAGALADHLEGGGVPADGLVLERVVVSANRPGAARALARVHLEEDGQMERARRLLSVEVGAGDPGAPDPAADDPDADDPDVRDPDVEDPPPDPRSLLPPGLHRLDVRVVGPDGSEEIHRIRPEREWQAPSPRAWQPRAVADFTLSELYTLGGIYRDTEQDLVPDRSEAYLSVHGGDAPAGAANLAARIGLETAGLRLPLAKVAGEDEPPEAAGFPILYGLGHFHTERLREAGRLGTPTWSAGEGFVEMVPDAFDGRNALVVGGSDAAGLAAAADLAARRMPYLHDPRSPGADGTEGVAPRKGTWSLAELENEVRRFFQARSAAGQVALALWKLDGWTARLDAGERPGVPASDRPWPPRAPPAEGASSGGSSSAGAAPAVREVRLEIAADSVPDGLEGHLAALLEERFPGAATGVEAYPVAFGVGASVFDESVELEWEVDEVRRILAGEWERFGPGSEGRIEVRVSEPPEIRRALAGEIADSLAARGVAEGAVEVRVLSAYKQGYSWLEDAVLPRLREVDPARIEVEYHHLQDSDELPWKVIGSDTRWLQELFPVDEVLARELGIPDSAVVFRATRRADPTYRVRALGARGEVLLEEAFSPSWVVRPYFDLFPDYERVRVTTGRVLLELDGERPVDRRVATDMERFWDFWQGVVLPRLRDYVMDLQEGRISPANAPFFDELVIEARLSEPNHRIGIDEEVISSLESLHNDLYFHTLAFLGHLGQHYGVGALNHGGRILPHIDPTGAGRPGRARVRLTGKERAVPEMILRVRTEDGEEGRWRYPLSPLPTEAPKLRGLSVEAAPGVGDALRRALFEVAALDSIDRFDEHRGRASEAAIDRSFLPVELLEGMVEQVRLLHGAGMLQDALSFEGVEELAFRFAVEDEEEFRRTVLLERSGSPLPTRHPVLFARGWEHDGGRLVQWESPIPPAESDSVMARLATLPEATVYHVGRSYLGRDIFAADFHAPVQAELVSQAKLNALRPTLFLSGRQHANEVSSTSHILRLGELLATDAEHRELLRRVNIVLHPITNPDGAQLAWEMQGVNPDFTLHAGYLGALGVDVTQGAGSTDPIYPESQVRPHLMATWLPDIYLNLHGYPSHEWVQHFSGYAAWVRGRTVAQRTWWAPRGWFIPGFTWVDDPDHPEITTAQFAILDTIARAITGIPEVAEMSERQYARYARYGRQDVDGFREHFHEGVLMYLSLRGRSATGSGPGNPRINTFSATTEAPDETARGEWLDLVATAGLAHTSALARYLYGGVSPIELHADGFDGWTLRRRFRTRPVLPPDEEAVVDEETASGGGSGF
jgi:hypothetical protein